jgi:glycosidase
LHDFYQRLLRLRQRNLAITAGECRLISTPADAQLLIFFRKKEADTVLVLLNVSRQGRATVTLEHPWLNGSFRQLFSELIYTFNHREHFELMEGEFLVYEKLT